MGAFVDIDAVKRRIPIMDVIRLLGIEVLPDGENFRAVKCPYCDEKRAFKITVTPTVKDWPLAGCFRCGKRSLNVVQLVMDFRDIDDPRDAADWITERLENAPVKGTLPATPKSTLPTSRKSTVPESEPAPKAGSSVRGEEKPSPQASPLEKVAAYIQPDHEAVLALGLNAEDAQRLGIGHAPKGTKSGYVLVPLRTDDGTIVDYWGIRATDTGYEVKLPKNWEPVSTNVVQLRPKTA